MRSYDVRIGQFTQCDLVRHSGSTSYGYVNGMPLDGVDPTGLFYCHRLSHFPYFWCWCGNPPSKSYKPLPISKIPKVPGPGGKVIGYVKDWDSVKCSCQDGAAAADAAMACEKAVQGWAEQGMPDTSDDPIMNYMLRKYGDKLTQMSVNSIIDKCQKAMCGKGMGDLVKQWVKKYK